MARDYKAAYRRRIERGLAKGLSRAAARGHPRSHEAATISGAAPIEGRLKKAFDRVANGESISRAAAELHISRERLRSHIGRNAEVRREGGRIKIVSDRRRYRLPVYSNGDVRRITVDRENATEVGRFMAAVGRFLVSNKPEHLHPFEGLGAVDVFGRRHTFETNPELLYRLDAKGEASFHQIYNTQESMK